MWSIKRYREFLVRCTPFFMGAGHAGAAVRGRLAFVINLGGKGMGEADEIIRTATHEMLHHAHPDMKEEQIIGMENKLVRSGEWRRFIYEWVIEEQAKQLHRGV